MQKVKEEIDTIMEGVRKAIDAHGREYGTGLPSEGREQLRTAMSAVNTYSTLVTSAYTKLEDLRLNDTMFPEGRKRMMRELLADADDKAERKHETAEANATVARATCIVSAFPKLSRSEETTARQDARMILDASKEPDTTIAQLAFRQDAVGALVVTQWGADYLHTRGYDERDVKNIQAGIIGMALDGAHKQSRDSDRSRAAKGAMAAQSLIGLNDAAYSAVTGLLSELRDYYSVPREDFPEPRDPRRPAAPQILGEDVAPLNL
ncbi:hypothetical protein [Streptomyces europaeiscabiei]|uniref:hypothetical protein n=1 Tax=Streptomyces europaeiscabiei TaxID=146819 RepID=UPI0029A923BE|nr:hypothetical protein [Streptomyces europaeiscabiei]MDX3868015.1 hypothetical protein [Streptomyces europaeiscabiei]